MHQRPAISKLICDLDSRLARVPSTAAGRQAQLQNTPIDLRTLNVGKTAETQQRLVDILFQALVPGGYLFTGDAEALHIYEHGFQTVHDAGCLIYKKMEMQEHGEAV